MEDFFWAEFFRIKFFGRNFLGDFVSIKKEEEGNNLDP